LGELFFFLTDLKILFIKNKVFLGRIQVFLGLKQSLFYLNKIILCFRKLFFLEQIKFPLVKSKVYLD